MMVTGRMLYHYNTRAMTGRAEGICQVINESYIEISSRDAAALGVAHGDRVGSPPAEASWRPPPGWATKWATARSS